MASPLNDGISAITLVNHMGDDLAVVNAARVSFDKESSKLNAKDAKLIKYLAEHNHWTPFSQPQLQFRIKMPIFVAREWYRHNVGLTRNEVSRRYVDTPPEFYVPTSIRHKPTDGRKQGSGALHPMSHEWANEFQLAVTLARDVYNDMITSDVAPEMARMILPQSMYTEFFETGSLAAYARIANLRNAPDAQQEIQLYAKALSNIIQPLFPFSWEALTCQDAN